MTTNPSIRVLHVVPDAWLPRTESWLHAQVRHLPAWVDSHVACERVENLDVFPVAHLRAFAEAAPARRLWDLSLRRLGLRSHLGFLARHARAIAPAVLHAHFGPTGWLNRSLVPGRATRRVVTFYGLDVGYLPRRYPQWRERYRELFETTDRVLCEGPHMARAVVKLGCPPAKVRVHHLGVAVDELPFAPLPWDGSEPLRILMAASFREKKGIPNGLEAIARLRSTVDVVVTLVGDAGPDERSQREKQRILDTIARHALGTCVERRGFLSHGDLLREARRHHVFLAPSITAEDGDTEGGAPVVLIEMLALGLVAVSTRHCDIPNIVRDGETGWLAAERDVDGLATCLRDACARPGVWPSIRTRARQHVETHFNARVQGHALSRVYTELTTAA